MFVVGEAKLGCENEITSKQEGTVLSDESKETQATSVFSHYDQRDQISGCEPVIAERKICSSKAGCPRACGEHRPSQTDDRRISWLGFLPEAESETSICVRIVILGSDYRKQ